MQNTHTQSVSGLKHVLFVDIWISMNIKYKSPYGYIIKDVKILTYRIQFKSNNKTKFTKVEPSHYKLNINTLRMSGYKITEQQLLNIQFYLHEMLYFQHVLTILMKSV